MFLFVEPLPPQRISFTAFIFLPSFTRMQCSAFSASLLRCPEPASDGRRSHAPIVSPTSYLPRAWLGHEGMSSGQYVRLPLRLQSNWSMEPKIANVQIVSELTGMIQESDYLRGGWIGARIEHCAIQIRPVSSKKIMLSETEFSHLVDCDNYFEFGDSQPFVTLTNSTNTSLPQWVNEQSSASLFSASPIQSIQSTSYSTDSSPLTEITIFADHMISDKREFCEKHQEKFEFYAEDMGLQQPNKVHG